MVILWGDKGGAVSGEGWKAIFQWYIANCIQSTNALQPSATLSYQTGLGNPFGSQLRVKNRTYKFHTKLSDDELQSPNHNPSSVLGTF